MRMGYQILLSEHVFYYIILHVCCNIVYKYIYSSWSCYTVQKKRLHYRQYYTCLSRILFIIRYIDTSNKRNIYEYMFNTLKLVLMYIYMREKFAKNEVIHHWTFFSDYIFKILNWRVATKQYPFNKNVVGI